MSEYGFSLTRIFPYKDRIYEAVVTRESTKLLLHENLRICCYTRKMGQRKTVFLHILYSSIMILSNIIHKI